MNNKKGLDLKTVHMFTENAHMKFRPSHFDFTLAQAAPKDGVVAKFSSIITNFLSSKFTPKKNDAPLENGSNSKFYSKSAIIQSDVNNRNRSYIESRSAASKIEEPYNNGSPSRNKFAAKMEEIDAMRMEKEAKASLEEKSPTLTFLEKISIDTFLIGNQKQLDLITISGIYDGVLDTDINWSLNIRKQIKKLSVDPKKSLLALECNDEVHIYKYDLKKIKTDPVFINKTKLLGEAKFLIFLKDSQFGVFYPNNATIYQIDENNNIRLIFNKRYGVSDKLQLFQIPKPIENTLNIFFKEKSLTSKTHVLWRLGLEFKNISSSSGFKSLLRIYDIPNDLVKKFKIDNFSKDIFIMNFKFEILAAKDGYIIDSANTNIQQDGSCLVYQGDHLLHVSQNKLFIYSFKIITNTKPNKVDIQSVDSINVNKGAKYMFFDCLEMLGGNFVLFFQIKPQFNNKMNGQIDYMMTVTQKLSIQQKLGQIFNFKSADELKQIAEVSFDVIQEKCDMAFKIGLNRRQVYLELWKKSNKKDIQDYKFLLDTMDYETIKQQIEKKLKKASMSFNEVYKLEQGCFELLRTDLFSNSNCSEKSIRNYLISHFLLRKLAFFRDIHLISKMDSDQNKVFTIDIQQYFHCVKMELKSSFLQYASKIANEDDSKKGNIHFTRQLRLFLRSFKFPLRIIYSMLLQDLIVLCKNKLIVFLMAIPQILPFTHYDIPDGEDMGLYEGLWSEIKKDEWTKYLHIEEISTIYNKEAVLEITKTVWFKRNQNSLHDLVPLSKQKIIEIQEFNHSDAIFYYFIQLLFKHSKEESDLKQVVTFLQSNYERLPVHLKDKIFLYRKLYLYFLKEKNNNSNLQSFNTFLKLKDFELFKELFKYEKIKKGCLLKDAKAIYSSIQNGNELYNEGLLNYFASDMSEISDLKYILNRLNNEKRQFHIENEGIYEVLVKGMQMKLKLGSDNDIPFDQVMIYVDNIPLSKDNPIIQDLNTVQRIGEESQRFKRMKLNMSFKEIIQRFEDVLTAMINQEIQDKGVMQIRDEAQLKKVTYEILAEIQTVKEKIYKDKLNNLAYFIYIAKIMEEIDMIRYADLLLTDPFLLEYYSVDQKIIENLVIYMYRWKLTQQPAFNKSIDYLHEILSLLPEDNLYKIYFESEIQFSIMLSAPDHPIQFRTGEGEDHTQITKSETLITVKEIRQMINELPTDFIAGLDIERLHELIKTMQELSFTEENAVRLTSLVELYEIIILRLINLNGVRQAIPLIRKLIELYGEEEHYCIVYCYFVLNIIMAELADNHKRGFAKIAFYTFSKPLQLLDIIQKRINNKFSNDEQQRFIDEQIELVRGNHCYNRNNFLLQSEILVKINEKEEKYYHKLEDLIFQTWAHINNNRQDFSRNYQYTYIYIMLLNNPYALAKFIHIKHDSMNIRILRSYLSYVFREEIFSGIDVLRFAKRMFTCVLDSIIELITIELVISQYKGVELTEDDAEIELPDDIEKTNPFAYRLQKSIQAFANKLYSLRDKPTDENDKKKKRIEMLLSSQASINEQEVSEYPFNDSDDNYEDEQDEIVGKNMVMVKNQHKKDRIFDANKERKMLLERKPTNNLYISLNGQENFDIIRRTSPSPTLLKSARTFQQGFKSLHFGRKQRKGSDSAENGLYMTDKMERTDSVDIAEGGNGGLKVERDEELVVSHNQDEIEYQSMQPILMRSRLQQQENKISKSRSNRSPSQNGELMSPVKFVSNKNSEIEIDKLEDSIEMQELQEHSREGEFQFKVNVQEINDDEYTSVTALRKLLLEDYGDNQAEPMFNLSHIAMEQEKEFDGFDEYLRKLIVSIYESDEKPLSFLLTLIKAIKNTYPQVRISNEFLENYIMLENYNIKYKYCLPIREMFPIDGIFLDSKDPKVLFHFAKPHLLPFVDFDNILIVAKLIHFSLKRSEIKDELYLAYLANAINHYGNDQSSAPQEITMQQQRIGGIIDQITMVNLFLERAQVLLANMTIPERSTQVANMIRETLRKKKREDLIADFDSRITQ